MDGAAAPAVGADRLSVPPGGGDRQPAASPSGAVDDWEAADATAARRRDRRRRCAREDRAAQRRSGRQPLRAAVPGLRGVVPRAVDSRQAGAPVLGRRGGRRARADARDPRRASLYRGRRRGDAGVVRVHRDQRARHGQRGRRTRRRRTGDAARAQQRAVGVHHHRSGRATRWSAPIITSRRSRVAGAGRAGGLPGGDSRHRTADAGDLGAKQSDLRARIRRPSSRQPARTRRRPRAVADLRRHGHTGGVSSTIPSSLAAVEPAPIVGGAELRFRYGSGRRRVGRARWRRWRTTRREASRATTG